MAHISNLLAKIIICLGRKVPISLLLIEKIIINAEYTYFADIFLKELANMLTKQIRANKYAIKIKKAQEATLQAFIQLTVYKT